MIECRNISKSFPGSAGEAVVIVKNCNFSVKKGDFVCIMGPSGSGKTTLLNMISGLDNPQEGDVFVNHVAVNKLSEDEQTRMRGQMIGFVFQQFYLLPNLTVTENIDLVLDINKCPRRFATQEILEKVGLADRAQSFPSTLSGGEQQRVALARAFVADTPILLADEPTGNLDHRTALRIMDLMGSLHEEVKNTIVMITHDEEMAGYADQNFVLHEYNLVAKQ